MHFGNDIFNLNAIAVYHSRVGCGERQYGIRDLGSTLRRGPMDNAIDANS